jgi:hypothetical protein
MHSTKEVEMSKHLQTPTSRLICFGGARALTNGSPDGEQWEDIVGGLKFDL